MSTAKNLILSRGIPFQIERKGNVIYTISGLPNHEKATGKQYIGFLPETDIQPNDWIINPNGNRLFIEDVQPSYGFGELQQFKAFYLTEVEYTKIITSNSQNTSNIFNIGSATGSVIGTQSVVNFSYTNTISELKNQVDSSNSPDKSELTKITNLLEMVINNELPPQKGMFSKFADVLKRNSWFATPMMSALFGWLTTQIS